MSNGTETTYKDLRLLLMRTRFLAAELELLIDGHEDDDVVSQEVLDKLTQAHSTHLRGNSAGFACIYP